jgi:hypothetical protein
MFDLSKAFRNSGTVQATHPPRTCFRRCWINFRRKQCNRLAIHRVCLRKTEARGVAPRQLCAPRPSPSLRFVYTQQEVSLSANDQKRRRPYGAFLIVGGWLLIRSASASNRLIPRRSIRLRSGLFAVLSSEAAASSCCCTSLKPSWAMIKLCRLT